MDVAFDDVGGCSHCGFCDGAVYFGGVGRVVTFVGFGCVVILVVWLFLVVLVILVLVGQMVGEPGCPFAASFSRK